ncbi:uncharacterized protein BP01DRAFT_370127 [Aspergillus saccharolyticus JOP 1030-1]|uniref:Uncharacterized protein n=1 Tax=Aspergillus saccharolyticus JOP 1030-1 TaxID=1450539 RepID=A0A318Z5Z4_9EURO|nr:hypothetical protein BP01DRAFT_370127 [Aspergillus saccharolyticus JOP 1030-1]PYH40173.1 hypothetical protein BP01DRAFT_370127 [Aspergillus saccharolyticus JOP 1030-1]
MTDIKFPSLGGVYFRIEGSTNRYGIIGGVIQIHGSFCVLTSVVPFLDPQNPNQIALHRRQIFEVRTGRCLGRIPDHPANPAQAHPKCWSREQGWVFVPLYRRHREYPSNYGIEVPHRLLENGVRVPAWIYQAERGDVACWRDRDLRALVADALPFDPITLRVEGYGELVDAGIGSVDAYRMHISVPYFELNGAWVYDADTRYPVAMIITGMDPNEDPHTVFAVDLGTILNGIRRRYPKDVRIPCRAGEVDARDTSV